MTNDTPHGPTPPDESSRNPDAANPTHQKSDARGEDDKPNVSFDVNHPANASDSAIYGEDTEAVNELFMHAIPDAAGDIAGDDECPTDPEPPYPTAVGQSSRPDDADNSIPSPVGSDDEPASGSALFVEPDSGDQAPITDVVWVEPQISDNADPDLSAIDGSRADGPIVFDGDEAGTSVGVGDVASPDPSSTGPDNAETAASPPEEGIADGHDQDDDDNDNTYADINLGMPDDDMSDGSDPAAGLPLTDRTELDLFDESPDATMKEQAIPIERPPESDGGINFDGTDVSSSGSNLFADVRHDDNGVSNVNLSEPIHDLSAFGDHSGASSIFQQDQDDDPTEAGLPGMYDDASDMDIGDAPLSSIYTGDDADDGSDSVFDMQADLDPPSELDMGGIPAPPSSIFRPVKNDNSGDGWGDDGDEGSIFDYDANDLTEADFPDMDGDPSELDMESLPAPPSSIFRPTPGSTPPSDQTADPANQGAVSFDLPPSDPNQSHHHSHLAETSGQIDWSVPPEDDDLKRYNLASTGATGPLHDARAEAGLDKDDDETSIPSPVSPSARMTVPSTDEESWADERPLLPPEPVSVREPAPVPVAKTGKKRPKTSKSTKGKSRSGLIAGLAFGLLAGVGVCTAAYLGGVIPSGGPAPVAQNKVPAPPGPDVPVQPAEPTLADAQQWLDRGDPARALAGFEAAPEDAPPAVRAGRGQARWLARVRELAANDQTAAAGDPELAKAEADLTAAATDPDAGVSAALHLGLLKEVTGDVPAARAIYADAADRFPNSRGVFEAALDRLNALQVPPGDTRQSRLTPDQAERLAHGIVLTMMLLQADGSAANETSAGEPGALYWKAINDAAAGNYDAAIRAIDAARKRHDTARLRHVGGGVNPQSDPLGQIFLRNADELKGYWTLKRELYGHPSLGTVVKRDGVGKTLDSLASAATMAEKLGMENKTLSGRPADDGGQTQGSGYSADESRRRENVGDESSGRGQSDPGRPRDQAGNRRAESHGGPWDSRDGRRRTGQEQADRQERSGETESGSHQECRRRRRVRGREKGGLGTAGGPERTRHGDGRSQIR